MRNFFKSANKNSVREIVFNLCMPIFLACISFVILFIVIYSQIGNPGRYIEILKVTTQSSDQVDLLTLKDIYEGEDSSEKVPVVVPGEKDDPGYSSGEEGDSGIENDGSSEAGGDGLSSIVFPAYNTRYGIFEVPKYNMKQDLFFGASYAAVEKGVGQSMGSYLPGFGGTTVLCTHNSRVRQFDSSNPITAGDEIKITTNYGVYSYIVESVVIVDTSDFNKYVVVSKDNNDLIFYTCYPLHTPSGATQRMIITAKLVSVDILDI